MLVAELSRESPEYNAFQLYIPAFANGWDAEPGTIPFVTVTGVPTGVAVPLQDEPEKNWYVTVPPAVINALESVAESVTDPPGLIELDDREVVNDGVAMVTVTVMVAGLLVLGL